MSQYSTSTPTPSDSAAFADVPFQTFPESFLMQAIQKSSQDTIYFKDVMHRFVWTSLAHARIFNLDDPRDMLGKTDADFFPQSFADMTAAEEDLIMSTGVPLIAKIESWTDASGNVGWYSAYKYPLYDRDGKIIGTWGTTRDITELKMTEAELERKNHMFRRLSRTDELSGLFNRRHFYDVLDRCAADAARYRKPFSLISLDVDHFKTINDTFGHAKGDEVIRHVADILLMLSRPEDTVFRIGGDEYMVVLGGASVDVAKKIAERIRDHISRTPIFLNNRLVRLTVSIGLSTFEEGMAIDEMVHSADEKLYFSKNAGRNRVS